MSGKVIIDIQDIHKRYKGAIDATVKGVSLQIFQGEIFGLLGPNGAGKTTTISMICGLFRPDSGSIRINGRDVTRHFERVKKTIGVVPQDIALYDNLSARENLRFFGKMYGLERDELHEKIEHFLQRFGLQAHGDKRVKHFSGGMKRRVNLIAAIMHQPKILILDEPTVGVDVQSRNVILSFLKEINEQGVTILYTSHLLEEAQQLCHRVAIIDMGTILSIGSPGELIEQTEGVDNLQAYFLQLTGETLRD
jgi:ABC-2 type transport system ATP-binding protein